MRILHLEKQAYPSNSLNKIEENHELVFLDCNTQDQLNDFLNTNLVDVIFTKLGLYIGESQIKSQPNLKYIISPTTGLNHIDFDYANVKNIKIISLKNEVEFLRTIKSTAEHTWLLLLAITRNLFPAVYSVKYNKVWDREPFIADELSNKTLGIIGFGRLGRIISEYGLAFGMKVIAFDTDKSQYNKPDITFTNELGELLEQSDFVLLLISWTKENINFFSFQEFDKMKKDSYFINTSRGELVDGDALLDALINKKIKGAAIDVVDNDSSWESNEIIRNPTLEYASNHDNLIISPHMGGYGKDSINRTREFVTELFLKDIK
jgi:D-3-phosphoglycerate dehydrogenase